MTAQELRAEVLRLRDGIRSHRDADRHELCWHHPTLWGLLPEATDPAPAGPETARAVGVARITLDLMRDQGLKKEKGRTVAARVVRRYTEW